MKLKECIEFGRICGLNTLDECVRNIEIHATMLFPRTTIEKEISELWSDIKVQEPEYYAKKNRG